jgi:hypothetical protein
MLSNDTLRDSEDLSYVCSLVSSLFVYQNQRIDWILNVKWEIHILKYFIFKLVALFYLQLSTLEVGFKIVFKDH